MLRTDLQATEGRPKKLDNENRKSFGEFIAGRRRALGMTQREFADRRFVNRAPRSQFGRGGGNPPINPKTPQ